MRPKYPTRVPRPFLVLALGLLAAFGAGCSANTKPIDGVVFPDTRFDAEVGRFATPIELCVPPALRKRQWNVEAHPFRIDLGPRAALHFERMVKARFREVEVTFDKACGATTGRPWITTKIVSAHREPYSDVNLANDPLQYTALETVTSIHAGSGETLWETAQDGVVGKPLPLGGNAFFASWDKGSIIFLPFDFLASLEDRPRMEAARRDFGEAMAAALVATNEALVRDADEIALLLFGARSESDKEGAEGTKPRDLLEEISPIEAN